jgi:hypothetical protein
MLLKFGKITELTLRREGICLPLTRFIYMKKIFGITILAAFITVAVSSCKSHERCPAYGKVEQSHKKSV